MNTGTHKTSSMPTQLSPESPPSPSVGHPFFTTSAVTSIIQKILQPAIGKQFWIKAEFSPGRECGGHFYCNLVETDKNGKIIAQINCRTWRHTFIMACLR